MQHAFQAINLFLDQFEPDVSGRTDQPVEAALREQLEAWARGDLGAEEIDRLTRALRDCPEAVEALARAVREQRSGSDALSSREPVSE